jgi:hypothetical protein
MPPTERIAHLSTAGECCAAGLSGWDQIPDYRWRQKFGGLKIEEATRLKDLHVTSLTPI